MTNLKPNCQDRDPEIWFQRSTERLAQEICASCPMMRECAEGAIRRGEECGVWGTTTPADRLRTGYLKLAQDRRAARRDEFAAVLVAQGYTEGDVAGILDGPRTDRNASRIVELRRNGASISETMRKLQVSRTTVLRTWREHNQGAALECAA